ncbi:hypothetical protein MVEN_00074900 [Mycena venus]|uniref:Uncharacterized protein n=1 Tax=Mycena venus TaxID=2733690 RepID=A0A8H6Z4G7_9AGAR|nr:hypothetical protein MVEN_00074900 [Mycena venus]
MSITTPVLQQIQAQLTRIESMVTVFGKNATGTPKPKTAKPKGKPKVNRAAKDDVPLDPVILAGALLSPPDWKKTTMRRLLKSQRSELCIHLGMKEEDVARKSCDQLLHCIFSILDGRGTATKKARTHGNARSEPTPTRKQPQRSTKALERNIATAVSAEDGDEPESLDENKRRPRRSVPKPQRQPMGENDGGPTTDQATTAPPSPAVRRESANENQGMTKKRPGG